MRLTSADLMWIMVFVVCVVFGVGSIGLYVVGLGNNETQIVTVTEKESIRAGDGNKYLIFTDSEVFENTDEVFVGKFNSSDFYRVIKVGTKYEFRTIGFRIPFLSMYKNIIGIKEIE